MFLLYSYLQADVVQNSEGQFRGLGHVDSRQDILTITLDYRVPGQLDNQPDLATPSSRKLKGRRQTKKVQKAAPMLGRSVDILLAQDKTALHSRKGDTGSVLWKARFDLRRDL